MNARDLPGITLNMPSSLPGAVQQLACLLGELFEKCRPGYCVSKSACTQIEECRAIANAILFVIEHQTNAKKGEQS